MKKRILIADDEKTIRKLYTDILATDECYETECYDNGIDAFESYKTNKPDMLILDGNMPGMTGFEVTKAVREQDVETPIAVISGGGLTDGQIDFIKNQPNTKYIQKPVDMKLFLGTVSELLEQ